MSKLLDLLPWISIPDAAARISEMLCEKTVTAEQVFQLALGGKLALSVLFIKPTWAQPVRRMSTHEKWRSEHGFRVSDDEQLEAFGELIALTGLYDLPMIGAERAIIQDRLLPRDRQAEPDVRKTFVQSQDGKLFLLKETTDPPPRWDSGQDRCGLPTDAEVVIRAGALIDFESKFAEKPLTKQERGTLLGIILAMAIGKYKYDPEADKNSAVQQICTHCNTLLDGVSAGEDTVRSKLKEAAKKYMRK
jgi:hypothetical protein